MRNGNSGTNQILNHFDNIYNNQGDQNTGDIDNESKFSNRAIQLFGFFDFVKGNKKRRRRSELGKRKRICERC
jgi:hypothetical protein